MSERAFGPRLQALVAVLSGAYRLSKRNIQQLMADCFGVELALGSISALEHATSEALQEPVAEARRFVQQQPVAHVDETEKSLYQVSARRVRRSWQREMTIHNSLSGCMGR